MECQFTYIIIWPLTHYLISLMTSNQTIEQIILDSYDILKKLGSGAYGHVWKVIEKSSRKTFALKKIFEAFQHSTDSQRTFREISILKKIKHKNIIKLHDVFVAKNERDIYLVFQYMQTDLYHAIYDNMLENIHKKYVLYQILVGTKYLHQIGLIHRDLKPSNILLDSSCSSKICDFGLARLVKSQDKQNNVMTEGVATRWYRAPQVLLGSSSYGQEADIWSIGCIMAQILIKNPIFPGSSTINQLQKIMQFTGRPDYEDTLSIQCQYAEKFIGQCGNIKQKSAKQFFGAADPQLVNLIYTILKFNPKKRLSIEQILRHQYFSDFYKQSDLNFGIKKRIQLEINDNIKLTTEQYKQLIFKFDTRTKFTCQNHPISITDLPHKRPESVKRDRSLIIQNQNDLKRSRISQVSPSSRSPQRFREIKKTKDSRFGKLVGSQKLKKRSDSKEDNCLTQAQNKQKRNYQLFSDLIKNKDSNRNDSKSGSKIKDKQNVHSNNYISKNQLKVVNIPNCLKRFESNSTTSRISFQGLKKTTNLKFKR